MDDKSNGKQPERVIVADWLLRLAQRVAGLGQGRYMITLTIRRRPGVCDWTVSRLGDVQE